jgi:hypothetical protein
MNGGKPTYLFKEFLHERATAGTVALHVYFGNVVIVIL